MLTVVAFVVALGLLIAVHEYGHYRMAVACGVKVLRFSVGFGRPLWSWQSPRSGTEFAVAAIPLGGYVRMLDEREGPVDPAERHLAFSQQPLRKRAAIVAAGPAANLLLAVLLYSVVNWFGVQEPVARLASPPVESLAYQAGLRGGELVQSLAREGQSPETVRSFEHLRWLLTQAALQGERVQLEISPSGSAQTQSMDLALETLGGHDADPALLRRIGLLGPWTAPMIGDIRPGSPAERAGLAKGDQVLQVGATPVRDGLHLRELIRQSLDGQQSKSQPWQIERAGRPMALTVEPEVQQEEGRSVGRIGAYVGAPPAMVTVEYGLWEGFAQGVERTWDVSMMSLQVMGRMLMGEASLKNLSGPLTIADYAGRSASLGVVSYLVFLALISVSLGVLNLLPVPVLDGGHLLYYLWEAVTGKAVSEAWTETLQRGGMAILFTMMAIALFNDFTRLFG